MIYLTNKKEADEIHRHFHVVPNAASHGIFMKRTVYMKLSVRKGNHIKAYLSVVPHQIGKMHEDILTLFNIFTVYLFRGCSHFESCDQDVHFEALPGPVTILSRSRCSAATCKKCLSLQRPTESAENRE